MSMNYSELVNTVEKKGYFKTRFEAVSFLIGYNDGIITLEDYFNIQRLYKDGFIEEQERREEYE